MHDKTEALASGGMVSSRHPLSAEAGLEILRAGGNAVDAAVAASFAESVVQPAASTIGGGGLFSVRQPDGTAHGINYMWQAPIAASADMFPMEGAPMRGLFGWSGVKDKANEIGGLAAAVPGSVAGLAKASEDFGRLPLAEVMKPAIRLARDGFPMDWYGSLMAGIHLDILKSYPVTAGMLLRDGEFPYRPSMIGPADLHRQRELAETLEAIAVQGAKAFYTGEIAASIVEAVNVNGGVFSLRDLETYEAIGSTPLEVSYRGHRVQGEPSGFTIYAQVLNVLSHLDFSGLAPDSAERLHLFIETFRHCSRDRAKFDPGFGTAEGPWSYLLSTEYSANLARQIEPGRRVDIPATTLEHKEAFRAGESRTVHIAAIDAEGGMASLTETVIGNYGSFVMSDTGVLLNNGMITFAPVPGYSNSIVPGRRPSPFITPLHVTRPDGRSIMTIGSSGGSKIMTSVLQIASYIIDHGMSPQQATSFPRIDFEGDIVVLDSRLSSETVRKLERYGHAVEVRAEELATFEYGNPCVLARDADGTIRGGVNPFQATVAVGYDHA
ncbi:gamma-glutamyltransferase family protein [Variovorax sp. SRS16]|uniref:gamma-glutamyltransferase family protein n=1 Tax=Variovorax sp. SRS16 TaxID=282217 RepID=UPI0013A5AFDB|nr:gamma-glutamyltransferase family protein [Variovorax sp. SRS16]